MSRAARGETIGQECDSDVVFVCDAAAHQRNDIDIVLLDDAKIVHADMQESGALEVKTGR